MSLPTSASREEHTCEPTVLREFLCWRMVGPIHWDANIWLVLFILPGATFIVSDTYSLTQRIVGLAGLALFIAAYVRHCQHMPWDSRDVTVKSMSDVNMPLMVTSLVYQLIAAIAVAWAGGWWVLWLMPFVVAIVLYSFPIWWGMTFTIVMTSGAIAATFLFHAPEWVVYTAIGCSSSCFAITLGFFGNTLREREQLRERQETLANQREAISRDIHDILGHSLTTLTLKTEVAKKLTRVDPVAAERELDDVLTIARRALADVRSTVTQLRSPDLASQMAATRTAAQAAGITLTTVGDPRSISNAHEPVMSWALRETTTNVLRHSHAQALEVEYQPGLLRVSDNGCGMDSAIRGNGLTGLAERCQAAGGSLRVISPGDDSPWSTIVEVRLP